jgi:crystallin alpha B
LSVKTEGDVLVILAKHETQTESGGSFISKQFEQRFSLPSGVKADAIISALSKDGILTVTAPRTNQSAASISSFKKTRGALEEEVFNPQTTQV